MSSSPAATADAKEQELSAFRNALTALANSEPSTLAKFSEIFKGTGQEMKESKVKLDPEEKKLANVIFGVPSKLPLLQLPDVPLIQILRSLDAFDIITLSLLSQKMKRTVRSANYPIETVDFYAQEKICRTEEEVAYDPYGTAIIRVNYSTKVGVIDSRLEDEQRFKVLGDMEITCESDSCGDKTVNFICPAGVDKKNIREFAHRHFLKVFQKIGNINLHFVSGNLKELYFWNYTKSLGWLIFAENNLEEISVEDMKFALEEVEADYLHICRPVQNGFRFSTGFKAKDVVIGANSSWVDLDAVINSTSSCIYLMWHEVAITKRQINNLLKLWISGERMRNLTYLTMEKIILVGDEDMFDGITVRWRDVEGTLFFVQRYNGKDAGIEIRDGYFNVMEP